MDLPVTAHAHGTAGIERCVAAGFDGIGHCTWLARDRAGDDYRPAIVEQIRKRRIFVCKTIAGFERWPLEAIEATGEGHPAWANFATFRDMIAAGVAVIAGTDAGIVDTSFVGLARNLATRWGWAACRRRRYCSRPRPSRGRADSGRPDRHAGGGQARRLHRA